MKHTARTHFILILMAITLVVCIAAAAWFSRNSVMDDTVNVCTSGIVNVTVQGKVVSKIKVSRCPPDFKAVVTTIATESNGAAVNETVQERE